MAIEYSADESGDALEEILTSLAESPRRIPSKYFYDEKGSKLFDRICTLDEYYPTRTEMAIMRDCIGEICSALGPQCLLVELGSGSSTKVRLLLDHLESPAGYVPVDIALQHLEHAAAALSKDYAGLPVVPVHADFTRPFEVPELREPSKRRVVYYPGSTIGNFTPDAAREQLRRISRLCAAGGGLLIGVDLKKDVSVLEQAYNDAGGVTAAFNKNILTNLNREFGADFDPGRFDHRAVYDREHGRIEMYLISREAHTVRLGGKRLEIRGGEPLLTEYSYKYSPEDFRELAAGVFEVRRVWTDPRNLFSVQYLEPAGPRAGKK